MNCCDDYGACRQGRDCPIRAIEIGKQNERIYQWCSDKALGMIVILVTAATTLSAYIALALALLLK